MHKVTPSKNDPRHGRPARVKVQALVILGGLTLGILGLALVSPEQLDGMPRLCLWSHLLGGPCPACGTCHALCALVHGDFGQAVHYNRNVLVVAPVLVCVWIGQFRLLRESCQRTARQARPRDPA